jgi:Holliday junction resolvase
MIKEFFKWLFGKPTYKIKRKTVRRLPVNSSIIKIDKTSWVAGRDFENYVYNHLVRNGYKVISRAPAYGDSSYNDKMDPFRDITFLNPMTKKVYHVECKYCRRVYANKVYFLKSEAQYWKYRFFAEKHLPAQHCIVVGLGSKPDKPWTLFVIDLNKIRFYNGYYLNSIRRYGVGWNEDLHEAIVGL